MCGHSRGEGGRPQGGTCLEWGAMSTAACSVVSKPQINHALTGGGQGGDMTTSSTHGLAVGGQAACHLISLPGCWGLGLAFPGKASGRADPAAGC